MEGPFVMRKGQWLTHEGGEHYAQALRDIPYHTAVMSSDFELSSGGNPEALRPIPTTVIRYDEYGHMHVNIDGQWHDLHSRE